MILTIVRLLLRHCIFLEWIVDHEWIFISIVLEWIFFKIACCWWRNRSTCWYWYVLNFDWWSDYSTFCWKLRCDLGKTIKNLDLNNLDENMKFVIEFSLNIMLICNE